MPELNTLENRLAELSRQIFELRKELNAAARLMERKFAGQEARLQAIESFRRWMIGLMTGIFMTGVAAALGWIVR